MKWLLLLVVVIVASVSTALVVLEDPGYVLLGWGHYTVESSLALFVIALLILYLCLYLIQRALARAWGLPRHLQRWQAQRRRARADRNYREGMRELARGHWRRAEKALLRHVRDSSMPMLHYLAAAWVAQQQGHHANRDHYLKLAAGCGDDLAVSLTQARLQITGQQHEQALATLTRLHEIEPRNHEVLRLLMQTYRVVGDWHALRGLLPALQRLPGMNEAAFARLQREVWIGLLMLAGRNGKPAALEDLWQAMPRPLHDDVALVRRYADLLHASGADEAAERIVRQTLKRHWDEALVSRYGELDGADAARQLKVAEDWLRGHGKSAMLLLTLGRLCLRNRLWGKARIYLETSIGIEPMAVTYRELGRLLEHLGDHDAAMNCYREGMQLAADSVAIDYPEPASCADAASGGGGRGSKND